MSGPYDPVLDKLSTHTRWPVTRTRSGYRLRFDYEDLTRKRIQGIDYTLDTTPTAFCPRMDVNDFDHVPIEFQIVQKSIDDPLQEAEMHYHTLDGKLHRNQLPAKYVFRRYRGQTVTMMHFRHGILHFDDGPAKKTLHGSKIEPFRDEHGIELPGIHLITVESAEYEWFLDGQATVYPCPTNAYLTSVRMILDSEFRYHDTDGVPAFSAETAKWSWTQRGPSEIESCPMMMSLNKLTESYTEGKYLSRTADVDETIWWRNNQAHTLGDFPPPWLLHEVNLWGSPFLRSADMSLRFEDAFMDAIRK